MHIRPILSTLRRHKTAALLIVLEIALSCAIVCNAVFLIAERWQRMDAPTGLAESELLVLRVSSLQRIENVNALTQQDLNLLRDVPGVAGAVVANQLPFGENSSYTGVGLKPEQPNPTAELSNYSLSAGGIATLGLRIVEGRDFQPDEQALQTEMDSLSQLPPVILTRVAARRLFPGGSAVGQTLYLLGERPSRVVGVVERLAPPRPGQDEGDLALILPARTTYSQGYYALRVAAGHDPAQVLKAAVTALEQADTRRVVTRQSLFGELRHSYHQQDRWMTGLLIAVCLALLVVTAFGIVGLASFWVQQRTRMIGVRRALGASRRQVLQYFQLENFLLTTAGIVLGLVAAYGLNQVLMLQAELPRLPLAYAPAAALLLWALGQVAVLGPARRAAALPPVVVMRGA